MKLDDQDKINFFDQWLKRTEDLYYVHDRSGRFLIAQGKPLARLGYTEDEVNRTCIQDIVDPDDFPRVRDVLEGKIERGSLRNIQVRTISKLGETLWMEFSAWPATIQGQECVQGVARDITVRKRQEEFATIFQKAIDTVPSQQHKAPILIFMKDREHRFRHVLNEPLAKLMGKTRASMIGEKDDPSLRGFQQWWEDDESVLTSKKTIFKTEPVTDPQTQDIHWYNTVKAYVELDGSPYVLGVSVEITQAVQTEERYKEILDQLPVGVYTKDALHKFTFANKKQLQHFGLASQYANHSIIGETDRTLFEKYNLFNETQVAEFEREEDALFNRDRNLVEQTTRNNGRVRAVTKIPLLARETGTLNNPRLVREIIGISRDVTAEVSDKEAAQELQFMLRQVIDALPQWVYWKDRDSCFIDCNKAFLIRHGKTRKEDVIGRTDEDLLYNKSDARRHRRDDIGVIRTGVPRFRFRELQHLKDGTTSVLETSKIPLFKNQSHDVLGVLGVTEDISPVEQSYERVIRYIAHGLKGRIVHIEGNIPGIEKRLGDDPRVRTLKASVLFLKDLVLRASKYSMFKKREGEATCDINQLFARLQNNKLDERLEVKLSDSDPIVLIAQDEIEDVIMELLSNSFRYAPSIETGGRITLEIDLSEENNNRCLIHIIDNGPGVQYPASALGKEDRHLHINPASTFEHTGIGLLFVTHTILKAGGSVREIAPPSKGAHFVIDLPLVELIKDTGK